jgi:hypothetical protein
MARGHFESPSSPRAPTTVNRFGSTSDERGEIRQTGSAQRAPQGRGTAIIGLAHRWAEKLVVAKRRCAS